MFFGKRFDRRAILLKIAILLVAYIVCVIANIYIGHSISSQISETTASRVLEGISIDQSHLMREGNEVAKNDQLIKHLLDRNSYEILGILSQEKERRNIGLMGVADSNGTILSRTKSVSVRGDNAFITSAHGRYLYQSNDDFPEVKSVEMSGFGNQLLMTTGRYIFQNDTKVGALFANYLMDDNYALKFKEKYLRNNSDVIFYTKDGGVYGTSIDDREFKKVILSYFHPESDWIRNGKGDDELRYEFDKFYIIKNIVFQGLENSPGGAIILVPCYGFSILFFTLYTLVFSFLVIKVITKGKIIGRSNKKTFKIKITTLFLITFLILFAISIFIVSNLNYKLLKKVPYPLYNSTLHIVPESGIFNINFERTVAINIDTGDEKINVVEAELTYDPNMVSVVDIVTDDSFCTFFIEKIVDNINGVIKLSCGIETPGYNGKKGNVANLLVKPLATGLYSFNFTDKTKVLANDGLGTDVLRYANGASYTIEENNETSPIIYSPTHPNSERWYSENKVDIIWQDITDATYVYSIDQNPLSNPNNKNISLDNFVSLTLPDDGIYYFHLGKIEDGKMSGLNHIKIQIDTTPPTSLNIKSSTIDSVVGDIARVKFEAVDRESGLQNLYYISINKNLFFPVGKEAYIPLPYPGNHVVTVRAYDKAGNYTEEEIVIKVKAKSITDYLGASIYKAINVLSPSYF